MIASQITKEEINNLPVVSFEGKIILVETVEEADIAAAYLSQFKYIGFDTETRPSFKKGDNYKVCLLQLSSEDTCYLFRLNVIGLPHSIAQILKNENILKIGLAIRDDFRALNHWVAFAPKGHIELQTFVKDYNILDNSLQKIFAILFHQKISKSQRLTNWEAEILTTQQQQYAATDAWACYRIYQALTENSDEDI
ncbi:MAG: 3'-5' exonuclease domain-containing protein 2 [Bacteroidales bacterium]|nr:3'-5' exonuclease domain-containing protein 2 [Bacteroidales bacterium]